MMRKKFIIFLVVAFVTFFSPQSVSAHSAGQLPYFKVNGIFSNLYPIPTTSLADFGLPQDDSPDLYLINTPIEFELDTGRLPVPQEVLKDTTFIWDFGDGVKSNGDLTVAHTYRKTGSFILEISAQTKQISEPQLIQSTLIHVVPSKPYALPKSIIKVNNESVKDPLLDLIKLEFGNSFALDGASSVQGSATIVKYFWDLGDGKSDQNMKLNYLYKKEQYAYFPVLRVTDENGLFADSFVQVTNTLNEAEKPVTTTQKISSGLSNIKNFFFLLLGGFILIVLWGATMVYRKKRSVHKSKH